MSLLWAIVLIGVLVTVHELGHYAAARLFDVKVIRLSIGFGPRLLRASRRGTEYALSAVPLGGYVKMLGEDPSDEVAPADRGRAFHHKPLWQRVLIVLAGPLANLILPAVIYFHYFASERTTLAPTVGAVFEGQPADGVLLPGDRVLAVGDEPAHSWDDVNRLFARAPGRELRVTIERTGEERPRVLVITPRAHLRRDLLGAPETIGVVGVVPYSPLAQIGVEQPSAAARAGLRTFDVVTSVQGRPVATFRELEAALQRGRGEAMVVTYLRPPARGRVGFAPLDRLDPGSTQLFPDRTSDGSRVRYETGIRSGDLFLHDVEPGSPAALGGLEPGDELVTLDGAPLRHWELLQQAFDEQPERSFRIGWRRPSGELAERGFRLAPRTRRDAYRTESTLWVFGASPSQARRPVALVPIEGRVGSALRRAGGRTVERIATLVRVLGMLASGRVAATEIGGPLMLFHLAGTAAARGEGEFAEMVALISVNLGLLNLLPIPLLDGGQLLLLAVEALRRRPIGRRARRGAGWIGVALLTALMLLAARNDIVRYWFSS